MLVRIKARDKKTLSVTVAVHHLIIHAIDPEGQLYEQVQKWTAVCEHKTADNRFVRPNCNSEIDPVDSIEGACKTDVDHTLGFLFNSVYYALWRCHHSIGMRLLMKLWMMIMMMRWLY